MELRGLAIGLLVAACSGKTVVRMDSDGGPTSARADSGRPRAQGAVELMVTPTPGATCAHTNGLVAEPSSSVASVLSELTCDITAGCKVDQFVVKDRDPGASISCQVTPDGENYAVSARLSVNVSPMNSVAMEFQVNGALSPSGGTATVNESNSIAGGGGSDPSCTIRIAERYGVIKKGAIWATFECQTFIDPSDLGSTGCDAKGSFLFENCD